MAQQSGLSRKKVIVYSVILGIMVIATGVLLYNNSQQSADLDELASLVSGPQGSAMRGQNEDTEEKAVTVQEVLGGLRKIGNWPVSAGTLGRNNPFLSL